MMKVTNHITINTNKDFMNNRLLIYTFMYKRVSNSIVMAGTATKDIPLT